MSDPIMRSFLDALPYYNALAEASEGFVWRMKDEELSPEELAVFDASFVVNMSVWETPETLMDYAYRGEHKQPMQNRKEWFIPIEEAHVALWWIEVGQLPTLAEAKHRLGHLTKHGETEVAFTFRKLFPAPGM